MSGLEPNAGLARALRRDLHLFHAFRLLATSYLFVPIFMLFQESRGLTYFQRLALGGLYSAVVILVEVPTGVLADRLGRRRSMMLGAATMIASCLLAVGATSFADFAVAEALAATSMALCSGADTAYLYDLLAQHGRGGDYARRESSASAMHLVGSAVAFAGGGLAASIDLVLPYYLTAVVAAAALIVAWALRPDHGRLHGTDAPAAEVALRWQGWWRDIAAALAAVRGSPRLGWLVAYSAVVFTLLRATTYIYQPYLEQRGFGTLEIGVLFAAMYALAAMVAFRTHSLSVRYSEERLLWALLGVLGVSFLLLGSVRAGPLVFTLLAVQAVASGLFSPLTKPLLHREVAESRRRAAVLSVESMGRRAALGVFAPLAGWLGQSHVMMLCGAVGLAGMLLLALVRIPGSAAPVVASALPASELPER